jgi:carboxyl-terminal processing protease
MGNPIVSINKLPAINLTCPTNSNNMNDAVGAVLVPSAVNVTYAFAGAEGELEALGTRITSGDPGRPAVEHTLLEEGVGYLAVRLVTRDLAARVSAARRALVAAGARGFLLDLRGNPGGDVAAAFATASLFVASGTPLARWIEPDGDERTESSRGVGDTHTPLVVLVDEFTASSAELLAGSLQVSERALLVGGATFGKGFATTPGGHLAAELRLPSGVRLQGAGLVPDLPVPEGILADGTDPRLQAALLLLRALLERAR